MKKLQGKIFRNKFLLAGILFILLILLINKVIMKEKKLDEIITYKVNRQDMTISVLEGGNLTALRSQKIRNEVPGQRNILEVVNEGILITEEDVKNEKVLVRMDSESLEEQVEQLEITVENSWSSFMEMQENLEIQKNQNESDIKQAELNVKFSKMDFEKYLGESLANEIIKKKNLNSPELIKSVSLAGESLNKKKELENEIDLAMEEVTRAEDTVEWSKKLAEKGYITKSELEADKLSLKQKEVSLEQAKREYQLFLNYDFLKQVEKLLSDYQEYLNEFERVKSKAKSKLIQAEANVKSKNATYIMNKNRLKDIKEQISKCVIKASQPGFVTYATSDRPWRTDDPIQPGTTVRQFQGLINLPDFDSMGVEVKIHESAVKKIKLGQTATIKVDAFPEKTFQGKVKKIAVMPDTTLKFLNPDINVYVTQISLDESFEFLKPGMSAQVEIIVKKLKDVLNIPLVAVSFREGKPLCAVLKGSRIEYREIELGENNDEVVEIKKGLNEGEIVIIQSGKISPQIKNKPMAEKGTIESKPEEQKDEPQSSQRKKKQKISGDSKK